MMLTDDQLTDLATLHLAAKQDGDTWDMLPLLRDVAKAQMAVERERWLMAATAASQELCSAAPWSSAGQAFTALRTLIDGPKVANKPTATQ